MSPKDFLYGIIIPRKVTFLDFILKLGWLAQHSNEYPLIQNPSSRLGLFASLQSSGFLFQEKLIFFHRLIAVDGEDNQNKAQRFLESQLILIKTGKAAPDSLQRLISTRIGAKAAGEIKYFRSAYGYAFSTYDDEMCFMLQKYMDADTQTKVYNECKEIKRFDLNPFFEAHQNYMNLVTPLLNTDDLSNRSWKQADKYWEKFIRPLQKTLPLRFVQVKITVNPSLRI